MASGPRQILPPPPPPRPRPPPADDASTPVPPPLSLEHLWQVRSGWGAKGPWVTLDVVTSRRLETQYEADNFESVINQADGTSYHYDMIAWEEQRPEEEYGRPLRRVPWSERLNEDWSPLGVDHARGGFCRPPGSEESGSRRRRADDDDAMSDGDGICWQFRGGKNGNGKWKWSDDTEWLEAAYQNRDREPVVRKTYHDETYEFDFTNMVQSNLTRPSAPQRAIRRWQASLDLPSD